MIICDNCKTECICPCPSCARHKVDSGEAWVWGDNGDPICPKCGEFLERVD